MKASDDRVEQHRAARRLHEISVEESVRWLIGRALAARGCQQNERNRNGRGTLPQAPRKFDAVHPRHLMIKDRKIIGRAVTRGGLRRGEPLGGRSERLGSEAPGAKLLDENVAIDSEIVDNHGPYADDIVRRRCNGGRGRIDAQRRAHDEARPFADFARRDNLSAHRPNQLASDCKAQPGAVMAARGGAVRLLEGVKDRFELVRRNSAAGVFNCDLDVSCLAPPAPRNVNKDMALVGELDRVSEKVRDDLADASRVADEAVAESRLVTQHQLKALLLNACVQ